MDARAVFPRRTDAAVDVNLPDSEAAGDADKGAGEGIELSAALVPEYDGIGPRLP